MAEEFVSVIKIEAGDSEQTVKGLKQQISDLRDEILNLEKGTKQYDDAVDALQDSQRKLDEVMSLTKKTATALEGSYDALVHKMAQLKKEWRATNDEARRNELGQQIAEINGQLKDFDASLGNFQRNVGNYQSALDGMEQKTEDFAASMRNMQESIEPTKAKFESVQKIASGVASGFAAVQGAAALLGVENEDLEKTFIKLQAAMALAQGIGGLGDLVEGVGKATVAFKGLNDKIKVISKTMGKAGWLGVILAVVAAVTALVKGLSVVKEKESAWAAQMEETKRAQDRLRESIENSNNEMDRRVRLMKAQGAEERAIIETQLAGAKINLDKAAANHRQADNQYRSVKDNAYGVNAMSNGAFKSVYGMSKDEAVEYYKELKDAAYEVYKVEWDRVEELKFQLQLLDEIEKRKKQEIETNSNKTTVNLPKDDPNQILKDNIKERISLEEQATKRKLKNLEVEKQKEKEVAYTTITDKQQLNARLEEIDREYAGKEYEIELASKERILGILYEWETANTDAKLQQVEISQEIADQEVEIEKFKQDRLTEIAAQGSKDRKDKATEAVSGVTQTIQKSSLTFKEQIEEFGSAWDKMEIPDKINMIGSAIAQSFSAVGDITNALADDLEANGEDNEKNAKKIKNLRIATATMDMLSGIVGAISSAAPMGPVGWALGAIQAASIATVGGINITKIKNTDFNGNADTSSVTPSASTYATELPATFTRQITGASEIESLNQDTRVYILESDIQASNKRVQVRESESSF